MSAGPIGVVLHGGLRVDFLEELGVRADVQWPVELGLEYGPIFTVGVEGRIGSNRNEPFGLRI